MEARRPESAVEITLGEVPVCSGQMRFNTVRRQIAADSQALYTRVFGAARTG